MSTASQEHNAERAKRVFDQQLRIVRQRELVAKLEHRDVSAAVLGRVRTVLAGLELSLAQLIAAYERARENKAANYHIASERKKPRLADRRGLSFPS